MVGSIFGGEKLVRAICEFLSTSERRLLSLLLVFPNLACYLADVA